MAVIRIILAIIGAPAVVLGSLLIVFVAKSGGNVLDEIFASLLILVGVTAIGLLGVIDAVQGRKEPRR